MFPYINAIFYAEFHPKQGPKVLFEVPEGFFESASGCVIYLESCADTLQERI